MSTNESTAPERVGLVLGALILGAAVADLLTMLLLWKEDISYRKVAIGNMFIGIGVGFAGTPASRSLTSFVPVPSAGMASGSATRRRTRTGSCRLSPSSAQPI